MSEQVAHVWGFYDSGTDAPRFPQGVAVSNETAYEVFCRLRRHHHHHGGETDNLRTTRTLGGLLVGFEYDVPAHGGSARIWHRVMQVKDGWPDPTADLRAATTAAFADVVPTREAGK